MLSERNQVQALNLNLEIKPLGEAIPEKFKIRRIVQNYTRDDASRATESMLIHGYFDRVALSPEARMYVLDLLAESIGTNPEATLGDVRRSLQSLPSIFQERPELKEAINILLG